MPYIDAVRKWYPDAIPTDEAVDRLLSLLERRIAIVPSKIMAADSICSDDLNSIEYPKRAAQMLGPFKMGGLNGFPFTGLTGMGAFAHHVPEDGAVFVYHAPHAGITRSGELGAVLRHGQSAPSACCGAARGALSKLLAGEIKANEISELDYQQNQIEQILLTRQDRIRAAPEPFYEATEVMNEAITERIDLLASRTKYPCRYLILMGAILINGDHDGGSYTSVRRLVCMDGVDGTRTDLLAEYLT